MPPTLTILGLQLLEKLNAREFDFYCIFEQIRHEAKKSQQSGL